MSHNVLISNFKFIEVPDGALLFNQGLPPSHPNVCIWETFWARSLRNISEV